MPIQASSRAQRGAGLWGTLFVFAVIAFIALVVIKMIPVYLNQIKVSTAVKEVAQEPGLGANASVPAVRDSLQRHWDIDDIEYLQPKDVAVIHDTDDNGETLTYDYEARVHLFYNIYVVVHFQGSAPMRGAG